ncbi:putative cysteine proteinase CG12163 isoform X2 [Lutzomyia longipalpis]|uniref:putative cysteine proteinase CG12163 isoform X2 n=1 Tax=Lutzomyia longipalpis TaxID=7200 RepID=UPI00248393B2|nr:putative cysteine proteinase CG12163 isoform X2 [Lutzomyia longipalpis]
MFSSRRKSLFLIFLSCVTISFVFCSETENVSVKTENLDVPSAEVADEDQPTSGERFVAIHVDTMGMREELSPTLLGLTHLALTFLPAEYQFLTVISAAREVVAGVRFILVVNAERVETGERVVCGMEILEKPWITTEWGEKWRMLERTNCTGSPNPLAPDKNQYSQVNPIFTEREKEVSEERMREVEKQIITSTTPRDFYEVHDTTTELPLAGLSDEMKALLDAFFQTSAVPRPGAPKPNSWSIVRENVAQVDGGVRGEVEEEKIEPKAAYPQGITEDSTVVSSTEAFIEITPTPLSNEVLSSSQITENPQYFEEDLGQQQIIDPFLQIDPANQLPPNDNVQEQIQEPLRQKRELGVTEKEEILLLLNRALQQLDVIDEDSSRRLAIDIYHVKVSRDGEQCKTVAAHAKVANSQCSEGEDENLQDCMENVFPETTKLCAIEATLCNDKSLKLKKTICKPIPEKKSREKRGNVPGGVNEIDLNDLKDESHPLHDLVRESLAGLSEKENGASYSFVRINSATKQVVAGMLYKVNLDVKDSNAKEVQCNLRIWERAWLNPSKEIDFDCNNSKKFKFTRARRSVDDAEQPHPVLVGGPTPIDVDNDDKVKELVRNSLVSFNEQDGNSFELHRIVAATKKVVAGVLYEIKAEFRSTGESKEIVTCNLSVWERPWLKVDNSQTDVACDNAKKYKFTRSRRSVDAEQPHPVLGGPTPIDVEKDEKVKNLVQNSLVSFNSKDGNSFELHRIVEATKKIVQGVLYEIKVEFRSTGDSKEVVTCNLSVWERPWLKEESSQTDVSCNNDKKYTFRAKRSLIYDHRRRAEDDEDEQRQLMNQRDTLARHEALFHKFQLKFGRAYHSSMEKSLRFRIFQNNLAKIEQLNEREQGTAKYGITQFADLTPSEYRMKTGLWRREFDENHISNPIAEIPNIKLPKSFDWRDKNAVSEVKNQGSCGSCWAFSVTGNIEGLYAIKTGQLEEFSEQELVDCDTIDGGCAGGLPDNAYKAIEQLGGLEYESEYPYRARKSECHLNKTMMHVKVKGAVDLPKNETAMQQWLVQNGPISIGINANAMQFYRGGVSHPWRPLCRHGNLDHGVLIVGYGVSEYPLFNKTLPYWIVKNSWGPKWGEQGYYRVFRGDNTCGVSEMATSAVLA